MKDANAPVLMPPAAPNYIAMTSHGRSIVADAEATGPTNYILGKPVINSSITRAVPNNGYEEMKDINVPQQPIEPASVPPPKTTII